MIDECVLQWWWNLSAVNIEQVFQKEFNALTAIVKTNTVVSITTLTRAEANEILAINNFFFHFVTGKIILFRTQIHLTQSKLLLSSWHFKEHTIICWRHFQIMCILQIFLVPVIARNIITAEFLLPEFRSTDISFYSTYPVVRTLYCTL